MSQALSHPNLNIPRSVQAACDLCLVSSISFHHLVVVLSIVFPRLVITTNT